VEPAADDQASTDPTSEPVDPTEPTDPTDPANDQSELGAYCTIPKAVLPVTDPEATPNPDDPDAAGSGTAASTQGRVVDGLCVPESETS